MQTWGDVKGSVAGLVGDPYLDWLTDAYFYPLAKLAQQAAINKLELTCSPHIEKLVTVPGLVLGTDEQATVSPLLNGLMKVRKIRWKLSGAPASQFVSARDYSVLPTNLVQATQITIDIEVRGDFLPPPPQTDADAVPLHPNMGAAMAFSVAALVGEERGNGDWASNYSDKAEEQIGLIAAALTRQQQRPTYRLGSPNGVDRRRMWPGANGVGVAAVGWEFRAFQLVLKQV